MLPVSITGDRTEKKKRLTRHNKSCRYITEKDRFHRLSLLFTEDFSVDASAGPAGSSLGERVASSSPLYKKSRPANADLLGAENETRARIRGHGATSFVVPSAGPAGSSLGERVASSSPLYKKKAGQLYADLLGAENETRTRDPNLGKVVLYQLSYFRIFF